MGILVWLGIDLVFKDRLRKHVATLIAEHTRNLDELIVRRIDSAFFHANPLHAPIYAPGEDFAEEKRMLERLGFDHINEYDPQERLPLRGIAIYVIRGGGRENPDKGRPDKERLRALLVGRDPRDLAVIIYAINHTLDIDAMAAVFPNFITANMPGTVASHIYSLYRLMSSM